MEELPQHYLPVTPFPPSQNIKWLNHTLLKNNTVVSIASIFIEPLHHGYYEENKCILQIF